MGLLDALKALLGGGADHAETPPEHDQPAIDAPYGGFEQAERPHMSQVDTAAAGFPPEIR